MEEDKIKILTNDKKVITLKDLFEGKDVTRKKMAKLPFEEKIKHLIGLQEIAYNWGRKKNVIVWQV